MVVRPEKKLNPIRGHRATLALIALLMPILVWGEPMSSEDSLSWPLLPGESVLQLSRAFYPENPAMQRKFIARTLVLSHELLPDLQAETGFRQTTTIVIPTLKSLAVTASGSGAKAKQRGKHSANLTMSYRISSEKLEEITPAMKQEFAWLTMRNARLKIQLDELYARISVLEHVLERLKVQANALLQQESDVTASTSSQESQGKIISATESAASSAVSSSSTQAVKSVKITTPSPNKPTSRLSSQPSEASTSLFDDALGWMGYQFWLIVTLVLMLLVMISRIVMRLRMRHTMTEPLTPLTWDQTDPGSLAQKTYPPEVDDYVPMEVDEIPMRQSGGLLDQSTITNAEMDFAVDKAQDLMSERKVQQAIDLLSSAINSQPKAALRPWLALLEIYRQLDEKEDFINLSKRFHQNYNVRMPQWEPISYSMVVEDSLERFPHICETLQTLWEQVDLSPDKVESYLDELILDNRQGEREGFYILVLQEIMLLKDVLAARASL